jgi:arylsulfatase A-like enzyme/Flp pilus assembly protein TadD
MRAIRGALLALLAIASSSCGGGRQTEIPAGTPVIIISIDTLRSDRLPFYADTEVDTPALSRLRGDSVLFEHAYAHIPLTLPSHASVFTGLLPPDHGLRDNSGYVLKAREHPYLPTILKEQGYATGAAVSSWVLRGAAGLDVDFDFYEDLIEDPAPGQGPGGAQRPGDDTFELSRQWLRSVADQPFLFFFHIYEPHTPYTPPEPFRSQYRSPYDAEVAHADAVIGKLLAELKMLEVYDRSIIFLISDHGEGLGEHDYREHGPFLYREAIQIPLLLKLPQSQMGGTSVSRAVQLIDILPTVLDLLDLEAPASLPGLSLLAEAPEGDAQRYLYSETYYPRLHFGWSDLASIIRFPYQYIHGPDPELYDLEKDPLQENNILRQERRVYGELKEALESIDRELLAPMEVDEETRQKMAALGYLSSVSPDLEGPLPDPKARVHVLKMMTEGIKLATAGSYQEGADVFRQVIEEEPQMLDAWQYLGNVLFQMGEYEEALEVYQRAFEMSSGAPRFAMAVANALMRLDRLEEAKQHAELAVELMPVANDLVAEITLMQGDLEETERVLERSLSLRGARTAPRLTLAELRLKQGRFEEALQIADEIESKPGMSTEPDRLKGLYFIRGQALAQMDRLEEAKEAFRTEIATHPDLLGAYAHLAFLLALEGRAPEAGAALRSMVEANPTAKAYVVAIETLQSMGDPRSAAMVLQDGLRRWPKNRELRELAG